MHKSLTKSFKVPKCLLQNVILATVDKVLLNLIIDQSGNQQNVKVIQNYIIIFTSLKILSTSQKQILICVVSTIW